MRVLNNRNVDRDLNDANAEGIVPVSPLPCKASSVRPVRETSEEGKLPSNILPFNHKEVKEVKEPNGEASMFPDSELLLNCKYVNFVNDPISVGMVPVNSLTPHNSSSKAVSEPMEDGMLPPN
jgi:hypothetical protein